MITSGVTNPRGIAVQPDQGLLAYSNWDDNLDNHPHIGKIDLYHHTLPWMTLLYCMEVEKLKILLILGFFVQSM